MRAVLCHPGHRGGLAGVLDAPAHERRGSLPRARPHHIGRTRVEHPLDCALAGKRHERCRRVRPPEPFDCLDAPLGRPVDDQTVYRPAGRPRLGIAGPTGRHLEPLPERRLRGLTPLTDVQHLG